MGREYIRKSFCKLFCLTKKERKPSKFDGFLFDYMPIATSKLRHSTYLCTSSGKPTAKFETSAKIFLSPKNCKNSQRDAAPNPSFNLYEITIVTLGNLNWYIVGNDLCVVPLCLYRLLMIFLKKGTVLFFKKSKSKLVFCRGGPMCPPIMFLQT